MNNKPNSAFLISLALCLISAITAAFAFYDINLSNSGKKIVVSEIAEKKRQLYIKSNEACFAKANLDYVISENIKTLKTEIDFLYEVGGQKFKSDVRILLNFNSIGQLFYSYLEFKNDLYALKLSTREINPIKVSLDLPNSNFKIPPNIEFRGPIEIKKNFNGTYRIEYFELGKVKTGITSLMTQDLAKKLNIKIVEDNKAEAHCQLQALNLDPFYFEIIKQANKFISKN